MPNTVTVSPGDKFFNWTVLHELPKTKDESGRTIRKVVARCQCGNIKPLCLYSLRSRVSPACSLCHAAIGSRRIDTSHLLGEEFGFWTVIETGIVARHRSGKWNASMVRVRCQCGLEKNLMPASLVSGSSTGCRRCRNGSITHGMSRSPEYRVWEAMLRRCYVAHSTHYQDYGGRGVRVCDRWNPRKGGSFENFYLDLGPRPGLDYQLDKDLIEGNLLYGPGTCKWVHRHENAKRKRNGVWVEWKGERIRLTELADQHNIPVKKLWTRIKQYGISVERAVAMG